MQNNRCSRRKFPQTAGSVTAAGSLTDVSILSMQYGLHRSPSLRFSSLTLGEVKPAGWIKAQLQTDLRNGFAGKLDQLAPAEVATDIFDRVRNRPGKFNSLTAGWGSTWWNGESESNGRTRGRAT